MDKGNEGHRIAGLPPNRAVRQTVTTQIAVKPPASPAANPNPSVKREKDAREKYRVACTAARDAVARLQAAKAQVRKDGGKPKPSWDAVLLEIIAGANGLTVFSRTCSPTNPAYALSVKGIAQRTGLSTNTVRAAQRDLEAMGCIITYTPATMIGQGHRTPAQTVALPMSPARRQDVMDRGPAAVDKQGEGATQTAGGRVQPRLHPYEKYEKNLNLKGMSARVRSASHSPAYSVATEHLPTPSKATPPKDMTPERIKAREAIQREIDERRSRPPGYAVKAAHTHDQRGTNGNGNPAGETHTHTMPASTIHTMPAPHKDGAMSWIEDAVEMHREADAMRDRCDALAEIPRGW